MLLAVVKRIDILFLSLFRKADTLCDNRASQMLTKLPPNAPTEPNAEKAPSRAGFSSQLGSAL